MLQDFTCQVWSSDGMGLVSERRMVIIPNYEKNASLKPPLFLPQLPKQAQLAKREASTDCLAIPASSTFGLKVAFFDKKCYFQPQY